MDITTKFNVGDYVYFVDPPHKISKGRIKSISIGVDYSSYIRILPGELTTLIMYNLEDYKSFGEEALASTKEELLEQLSKTA